MLAQTFETLKNRRFHKDSKERLQMKIKYLIPIFVAAAAFAQQDMVVTGDMSVSQSRTIANLIYHSSATVTVGPGMTRIQGTGDIIIDGAYDAVFDSHYFLQMGNKANTVMHITGVGKDSSSFSFTGYHLTSWRAAGSPWGCGAMEIKNITLNYTGSYDGSAKEKKNGGYFRAGQFVIDSAVVNMKEGVFAVHRDPSILPDGPAVQLKNGSELNFAATTSDGQEYAPVLNKISTSLDATQMAFELSGASKMTVGGSLDMNSFGLNILDGSSVTANKISNVGTTTLDGGSTLTINNSGNFLGAINVNDSASKIVVADNATLATGGAITLGENATKLVIGGGTWDIGSMSSSVSGIQREIYVTAKSLTVGSMPDSLNYSAKIFIGLDEDGNTHDVNVNFDGGVQFNNAHLVIDGKTTVNVTSEAAGNFNLVNSTANENGVKDGSAIYIGKDVTLNFKFGRITGGYLDGDFTVNGGKEAAYGWNYTFALGVAATDGSGQSANVTIGQNAKFDITGSTSTAVGKNFTLVGNITSNAATGAIKSDKNAGLYIRSINSDNNTTTLNLNSTDAFAVGGAATQAQATFIVAAGTIFNLNINADNNLGRLMVEDATSLINLSIAQGKTFTLGSFENEIGSGMFYVGLGDELYKGSFRITDMDTILADYVSQETIKFTDANGFERTLDTNLFIEKLSDGSYTIYTAVPEPAAIAALLGVLAIGFAAYRRRK